MHYLRSALIGLLVAEAATAQSNAPIIQDNSFLVEEAYNQEPGVVQHIFTFQTHRGSSDYEGQFTQEWPAGSQLHQISYDLLLIRVGDETGIGDTRINYRYQAVGSGQTRLAVAPRVSVTIPTGDRRKGLGKGGVGFEGEIPLSYVISSLITSHTNVGASFTPIEHNIDGARARTAGITLGQSFVFTGNSHVHVLVETLYSGEQVVIDENEPAWTDELVISPGIRTAVNFASGLQIVPGFAVPIGIGPSHGERGMFFYLSFEHPFLRSARPH